MNKVSNSVCGVKDEEKREKYKKNMESIFRNEYDLPDNPGEEFLYVGFPGTSDTMNHGELYYERKDKSGKRRVEKIDLVYEEEGNSSAGAVSGNPAMVRVVNVTENKQAGVPEFKLNLNLISRPILITKEQKEKLLTWLQKEVNKNDKKYNMSGNHSIHQSVFSGADYDSCLSFVERGLMEIGVIKKNTRFNWNLVLTPGSLMSKVPMVQPKEVQRQLDEALKQNAALEAKVKQLEEDVKKREDEIERLNKQLEMGQVIQKQEKEIEQLKQQINCSIA